MHSRFELKPLLLSTLAHAAIAAVNGSPPSPAIVVPIAARTCLPKVNGYSGYDPPYYEALRALSRAADGRLFEPLVNRGDLDVLVSRDDSGLRSMVERQPGAELLSWK